MKVGFFLLTAAALCAVATSSYAGKTERASVDSSGGEANWRSVNTSMSAEGRYIAFASYATNLVPGDTNQSNDVFVHDRQTGVTERVSVDSQGNQADGTSLFPSISADGRYVAFSSSAGNLVPGDTNQNSDVFVHDRQTGVTERVSVSSSGTQAVSWSATPSISARGRYVAFNSIAPNLVPGDTNQNSDIFVHDRQTGVTERVSVSSTGGQGNGTCDVTPGISADGRYVAFMSYSSNLVPGDTNQSSDVFVHDRQTGVTERVSVDSFGMEGDSLSSNPSISADGRYVAFESTAGNLVAGDTAARDIFVHDRETGITELVSVDSNGIPADGSGFYGDSYTPAISADGRYVVFASYADNFVDGDTNEKWDIFLHDRETGITERVSVDSDGNQADFGPDIYGWYYFWYYRPSVSADGKLTAFVSNSENLVSGDTNLTYDVFIRDRGPCTEIPEFEILSFGPETIWPPKHKDVDVTATGRVIVPNGCTLLDAGYKIYDEYGSTPEGEFVLYGEGYFTFSTELEAWRRGNDRDGRLYSISFTATDEAEGEGSMSLDVVVPHNRPK